MIRLTVAQLITDLDETTHYRHRNLIRLLIRITTMRRNR